VSDQAAAPPLRIAMVGYAFMGAAHSQGWRNAHRFFDLPLAPELQVLCGRTAAATEAAAHKMGWSEWVTDWRDVVGRDDVDVVDICTPGDSHAEIAIAALEAGKHVLCEKPLAASAADARAMFDAAKRAGVYLVEGYPYRAQPQTLKLRQLLKEGAIGRPVLVQASFGFPLTDAANIRMSADLAGGALMDAGSYPVSLVRTIAGAAPQRVSAMAQWGPSGVDVTTLATLQFPDGLLAQISCTFASARHRHAFIAGEAGSIATTYYNDTSAAFPPLLDVRRGTGWDAPREVIETAAISGFLAEAESFHDLVRFGWSRWTGATPDESIDIARTLDALAASARQGTPVVVGD
jgi:D-xylose 1-dehydrogenase (NADP+, D-xylono-1,5-lactone-forming)